MASRPRDTLAENKKNKEMILHKSIFTLISTFACLTFSYIEEAEKSSSLTLNFALSYWSTLISEKNKCFMMM